MAIFHEILDIINISFLKFRSAAQQQLSHLGVNQILLINTRVIVNVARIFSLKQWRIEPK